MFGIVIVGPTLDDSIESMWAVLVIEVPKAAGGYNVNSHQPLRAGKWAKGGTDAIAAVP